MRLNGEQQRELSRVARAGNRLVSAREELRAAVFDAVDAGVPQSRVAEASGLGRMTLYRWLRVEEGEAD